MKIPEKVAGMTRMHDYKGFTVEPVIGGYTIIIYGRMKILYIGGPGGWHMVEDLRQARSFRTAEKCHEVIDEILADHAGWVQSLGGVKFADLTDEQKQKMLAPKGISAEQIQDIKYHECF